MEMSDDEVRARWGAHYAISVARCKAMTIEELRALWDLYDGIEDPKGIAAEAVHAELNQRGDGSYCAI